MGEQLLLHPISEKLKKQLGEWVDLYPFFASNEWLKIKETLKADLPRITPPINLWFKAFRCCPPDTLKVVWLGMSPYYTADPYTHMPVADGLTFSTDTRGSVPPSLYKLYKGMEKDLWNGLNMEMERCNNLDYLAYQGVLLLNSALTTIYNDSKAHIMAWKPFMKYLIAYLNDNYEHLVFVGFGTTANEYLEYIDQRRHCIINLEHPAVGAYQARDWSHENAFSRTDEYLSQHQKGPILWDKYLLSLEPPF